MKTAAQQTDLRELAQDLGGEQSLLTAAHQG